MTATLPEPPRVKRSTRTINPCAEPKVKPQPPGSYDVFYGPFESWCNVKNPPAALSAFIPAAVGDGITDDTNALQAALDFCGVIYTRHDSPSFPSWLHPGDPLTDPGMRGSIGGAPKSGGTAGGWNGPSYFVVYLPAGIYRISRSLHIYNRSSVRIIGEDPRTTIIQWHGASWLSNNPQINGDPASNWSVLGTDNVSVAFSWDFSYDEFDIIHFDGGQAGSAIRRLTLDGNHEARICLNYATTGWTGGPGMEHGEILDVWCINAATGIQGGGLIGSNDATTAFMRCRFVGLLGYGFVSRHQNNIWWMADNSIFIEVATALLAVFSQIYANNCLFINCVTDIYPTSSMQNGPIRGNTSICTSDRIQSRFYYISSGESVMIQGNLIIRATAQLDHPLLYAYYLTLAGLVDNAFYDQNYLTNPDTGYEPIYFRAYFHNTGLRPDGPDDPYYRIPSTLYFSGNTYNGLPTKSNAIDDLGKLRADCELLVDDNSLPAGYIPQNHLQITQAEIKQLLQATSTSPILADIIGRMPSAPERVDPSNNALVRLTDIFIGYDFQIPPTYIDTKMRDAIDHADPEKINIIHCVGYQYVYDYSWEFPSGIQWVLIGDDSWGASRFVRAAYSPNPIVTFGTGGVVKARIIDFGFYEYSDYGSTSGGILEFRTGDMRGARFHASYFHGEYRQSYESYALFDGFERLKARCYYVNSSGFESRGVGKVVNSNDDVMLRIFGISNAPFNRTPYYVSNGGSMHVYDMYTEQFDAIPNFTNAHGYYVSEDFTRILLNDNLPLDDYVLHIDNYTGNFSHLLTSLYSGVRYALSIPNAGSVLNVWGTAVPTGYYAIGDGTFTRSGMVADSWQVWRDSSQLLGLTQVEGLNTPVDRMSVGGYTYWVSYQLQPTRTQILAQSMDDTQGFLYLDDITGPFWYAAATFGEAYSVIQIDDEYLQFWNPHMWTPGVHDPNWAWVERGYRGSQPQNHAAGSTVKWVGYHAMLSAAYNLPTSIPSQNFTLHPIAKDALRYRPFPQPGAITNPNVTDIVLHNVGITAPVERPFAMIVRKD